MTKVYIAGHQGLVGSALVRKLQSKFDKDIQLITRSHRELDLTNQQQVDNFIAEEKPSEIYLAAAKVGGIHANTTYPVDFIYTNLMIQSNVINAACQNNVKKLLFLGSSCIYPKNSKQPIQEGHLLTNTLESSNEPYALAKIAGIKLCESYNRQYGVDFRSIMPTNLYGPNDNFHHKDSHVIPSLIRKFHEAKVKNEANVEVWGSGNPKREFLHVDDMADASVYIMNLDKKILDNVTNPMLSHINIGTGEDTAIKDVAKIIRVVVGFNGEIIFNTKMPDGVKRKLLDTSKIKNLGWKHSISLRYGLEQTYKWFLENLESLRY
jgi:GDP-L-fucose synthase